MTTDDSTKPEISPALKAIETSYAGRLFRSRTEARWAVFFTAIQQPWHYELEGFDLPGVGRYLPDFYDRPVLIEAYDRANSYRF